MIDKISAQERIEMVQNGFNPLNPSEVARFRKGAKPSGENTQLVGSLRGLGEGKINDQSDYKRLNEKGLSTFDEEFMEDEDPNVLRKKGVNKEYGGGSTRSLSKSRPVTNQKRTLEVLGPNATNKTRTKLVTNGDQARELGYDCGIDYLNAFIKNLKEPHSSKRNTMIELINHIAVTERGIHESVIKYFKAGLAKAEKELYEQLR